MSERCPPLGGIQNFRDFGGYGCAKGMLRTGKLFRSAHLGAATETDIEHLRGLDLSLIVDLRNPKERARDVTRLHDGFAGRVLTSDLNAVGHPPHLALLERELTPDVALTVMSDFYRAAPFDGAMTALGRQYFAALAKGSGGVLVHCAAGKDRTGVIVALTHAALGVHPDDILADYMLTNTATRLEARLPELSRVMADLYQREVPEPVIRAFLVVAPAYIEAAFAAIRAEYGSTERYLAEHIGLDAAMRDRLEAKLLG